MQFEMEVPHGVSEAEIDRRKKDEALAAKSLADSGHLVRLWQTNVGNGRTAALGLYRANSVAELTGLLGALPLSPWLRTTITPLGRHPNDPVANGPVA